ncbi:LPS export ABC transporter permease LptF [Marinospirillum alkaliphilum]|uniref:Lipopolysaccharide export system permease protein LptF n=1 Tax=Marinospirillum alkaliphilum DSM 21637 TaxID=1122209 RepID=A0A1K1V9G2_9GAMM|nr:LPS export ABC transporter permease LptF [Marinospirillum alkaliphilum]SFX21404.1 lipopolysaccharide export system permease protein [Marinospirillum alkaliphilum DSM 21637]
MILYRYIAREVLITTLAVSSVLLLVIVGSRFARLLGRVASGRVSLDVLGQLTFLYLPYAAQLILPISFVLALMLTFGRLYMESEMSVIQSSGVGQRQLLKMVLVLALLVASITGLASLYVTPLAQQASTLVMQEQRDRTGFESITPGQFVQLNRQTVYVDRISEDKAELQGVFIAQTGRGENNLALAQTGQQQLDELTRSRFLLLEQGHRYELPGETLSMTDLSFERYAIRLGVYLPPSVREQVSNMSVAELLVYSSRPALVELQWRLGLPLMLVVMVFIALPLTRVNPRQGRFMTILPVLLLQLLFLGGLMSLQDLVNQGKLPLWPGLWSMHLLFLLLGLLICWRKGVFIR